MNETGHKTPQLSRGSFVFAHATQQTQVKKSDPGSAKITNKIGFNLSLMIMRPPLIIIGTVSEAFVRGFQSFLRSRDAYERRVRESLQPSFPLVNFFEPNQAFKYTTTVSILYLSILIFAVWQKYGNGKKSEQNEDKHPQRRSTTYWSLLFIYNLVIFLISGYITVNVFEFKFRYSGMLVCNALFHDTEGQRVARSVALLMPLKTLQLADSLILLRHTDFNFLSILRSYSLTEDMKERRVRATLLHVSRQLQELWLTALLLPLDYNGDSYFAALLSAANICAVSAHRLLRLLQRRRAPTSPIGLHLTSLQLFSLLFVAAQTLLAFRIGPTCGMPDWLKLLLLLHCVWMLGIFVVYLSRRYLLADETAALWGVAKSPPPLLLHRTSASSSNSSSNSSSSTSSSSSGSSPASTPSSSTTINVAPITCSTGVLWQTGGVQRLGCFGSALVTCPLPASVAAAIAAAASSATAAATAAPSTEYDEDYEIGADPETAPSLLRYSVTLTALAREMPDLYVEHDPELPEASAVGRRNIALQTFIKGGAAVATAADTVVFEVQGGPKRGAVSWSLVFYAPET